jgi:hypothetical protein
VEASRCGRGVLKGVFWDAPKEILEAATRPLITVAQCAEVPISANSLDEVSW